MRALVIGGTRFVGPEVVKCLHTVGHEVTLFHRGRTEAELPPGVRHILGDRQHLSDFAATLAQINPQVVLDMIPFTEQQAQAVMKAFRGIAGRVVAISSQDIYRAYSKFRRIESGPPDPLPLTEDAPLRERLYPYRGKAPRDQEDPLRWMDDYDKILVERVVMGDPDLPGTILRLPMVYGPKDRQHRPFEYLKRMDDRRPAILLEQGLADWRWTRGYVENVAAAIALAVSNERAAGRIYNVGETETLSITEWVGAIGQAAGWSGKVVVVPRDRLPQHLVADVDTDHHLVTDSRRIREELGYSELVSQEEALRRTVAWERKNPPERIDPQLFDYAAEDALLAALAGPS